MFQTISARAPKCAAEAAALPNLSKSRGIACFSAISVWSVVNSDCDQTTSMVRGILRIWRDHVRPNDLSVGCAGHTARFIVEIESGSASCFRTVRRLGNFTHGGGRHRLRLCCARTLARPPVGHSLCAPDPIDQSRRRSVQRVRATRLSHVDRCPDRNRDDCVSCSERLISSSRFVGSRFPFHPSRPCLSCRAKQFTRRGGRHLSLFASEARNNSKTSLDSARNDKHS